MRNHGEFGRTSRYAFNILNGTMSVANYPRPQLVRDMVFMTDEQRLRHTAKPGLSGLAQVNGRNAISWEDKPLSGI
ncbi:MAG: sugar transferase [Anaerobutyricum sp.]